MTAFMTVCPRLWDEILVLHTMDVIIEMSKNEKEDSVILNHRLKKLAIDEQEQKTLVVESTKVYAHIWEQLSTESIAICSVEPRSPLFRS